MEDLAEQRKKYNERLDDIRAGNRERAVEEQTVEPSQEYTIAALNRLAIETAMNN